MRHRRLYLSALRFAARGPSASGRIIYSRYPAFTPAARVARLGPRWANLSSRLRRWSFVRTNIRLARAKLCCRKSTGAEVRKVCCGRAQGLKPDQYGAFAARVNWYPDTCVAGSGEMRTLVVRVSVAHCSREITGDAAVLRLYVGIVYGPNIYQRYAFVRFKNRRIIGHMVGLFTIRGGLSDQ